MLRYCKSLGSSARGAADSAAPFRMRAAISAGGCAYSARNDSAACRLALAGGRNPGAEAFLGPRGHAPARAIRLILEKFQSLTVF